MATYSEAAFSGKHLFIGIDLHRQKWHITIRTEDGLVLFSNTIDGTWSALRTLLARYQAARQLSAVYEAGYFGFWLYDLLIAYGIDARVTPPSLIPQAAGNRVKTDRRDSAQLAQFLQAGLVKAIWVPTPEQRAHRTVARRRRQLLSDRVRVQQRIKAELRFYGLELPQESHGAWTAAFGRNLRAIRLSDASLHASFSVLLDQYEFLTRQIAEQTARLKALADSETYQERVALLTSIPGIGWLSAIELLVELGDLTRFQRAEQLAAYIGLTPAQHSSGEHVRLGHITRQGKATVRALLIQAAWRLIEQDSVMREKYVRIKGRAGAKRAIVAIARTLVGRLRHLVIHQEPYALGVLAG